MQSPEGKVKPSQEDTKSEDMGSNPSAGKGSLVKSILKYSTCINTWSDISTLYVSVSCIMY